MSLKSFHIFFIVLSVILAGGFGYWGLAISPSTLDRLLGVLSIVSGIALVIYLVWFLKKIKKLNGAL